MNKKTINEYIEKIEFWKVRADSFEGMNRQLEQKIKELSALCEYRLRNRVLAEKRSGELAIKLVDALFRKHEVRLTPATAEEEETQP